MVLFLNVTKVKRGELMGIELDLFSDKFISNVTYLFICLSVG